MKKFLIGALALFPVLVFAAVTLSVKWAAPTTYTDGTTISDPITYNVYVGATGAEVKSQSALTATQATIAATANVQQCATITAVVNGVESAQSAEGCATKGFPVPSAPGKPTLQ